MIAVIDDDESVLRSVARFLRASGITSVTYRSAEAFLADERHRSFDCLIVDLQLDGLSGTELRKRLTTTGINTPMILMTARDIKELDEAELRDSGLTLLHKSESGEALLDMVRRVTPMRAV